MGWEMTNYLSGVNRMIFLALSNSKENRSKISFLPRINGVFSFAAKAQVISIGSAMILMMILPMRAGAASPPIPRNLIFGQDSISIARSSVTDSGMMVQSAPVSTRKSKFWYPYLVRTGILIMGSARMPSELRFSPNENSPRIDTKRFFGRDVSEGQVSTVQMFSPDRAGQLPVSIGTGEHMAVFASDKFAAVSNLDFGVRHLCFHSEESISRGSISVKG